MFHRPLQHSHLHHQLTLPLVSSIALVRKPKVLFSIMGSPLAHLVRACHPDVHGVCIRDKT